MASFSVYCVNVNGLNSKLDSCMEILTNLAPDVATLCELKTTQVSLFKQKLNEINYELIIQKKSGIAAIAKKSLNIIEVTASNHTNILSVSSNINRVPVRLISVYGFQETAPTNEREELFDELNVEIEHCMLNGENPIILGDLNAKITNTEGTLEAASPNGRFLLNTIEKYSLAALNFDPKCVGKWTRSIEKKGLIERSVLDYIITNRDLQGKLQSMLIDEEKMMTPYRISGKSKKQTFSDHNAMITKFVWKKVKEKELTDELYRGKTGWKINSDGLTLFKDITTNEALPTPESYQQLEEFLDNTMNQCFKRRRSKKKKESVPALGNSVYWETIESLKPFLKKGKVERKVAAEMITKFKDHQLKEVQQSKANRVKEILSSIQSENGEFSPEKFWKLKKSITSRNVERTSIINDRGIEVFDKANIMEEFKKEFKKRLSHREIDPHLKEFESTTQRLLQLCLSTSSQEEINDITDDETKKAIDTLKIGKSSGTDQYPPDIFIEAGPKLRSHLTAVFNNIKNNLEIPESWFEVIVTTIFKNKGTKKNPKYYRGVFLACVLYKIFEKIIKQRIKMNLEKIDLSQAGGRNNKSPADSVFILNAVKDHALYLNCPLYITFYDYTTCFDSLWLEDSMISLWNLGIQDRLFNLIYLMNEKCNIVVRTAHGTTSSIDCPKIVKQGTVLSGNLCTASTGELHNNLDFCGVTINSTNISASLFVDDTWTPNTNVLDSSHAHDQFVSFTKRKRLGLNDKCVALGINLKKGDAKPQLKVNGKNIEFVRSTKSLGDMVSDSRSNKALIDQKISIGKGALASILAMCNEVTFGIHHISLGLLLYESVFLQSFLFNSGVWTRLTKTDVNRLKTTQLKALKRITHLPNSTPNCFVYLELGILPVEHELDKRKLMFLYHIHSLREDDPVKNVYHQQKLFPFEENWNTEAERLITKYDLSSEDITNISKNVWKNRVNSKIISDALKKLQSECAAMSKAKPLVYDSFKSQKYLSTLPAYLATFLLKIRSRTLSCRVNHRSSSQKDLQCRLCHQAVENQEHTINCFEITKDEEWLTLNEYTSPITHLDRERLTKIYDRFTRFQNEANAKSELGEVGS